MVQISLLTAAGKDAEVDDRDLPTTSVVREVGLVCCTAGYLSCIADKLRHYPYVVKAKFSLRLIN
jgi:hypothetical protein